MLPIQYPVGLNCMVKDVTNGALQVVPAIPFKCEGNLFYRLQLNGALVLFKPGWEFLICEARKITLRQSGEVFTATIKFSNNGKVDVVRIDPVTREIKSEEI